MDDHDIDDGRMDSQDRQRHLAYFERLGVDKVRLYTRVDCERFLGNWQVRELAEEWLATKESERPGGRFLRWRLPSWRRRLRD